jgi:hypothetical protein
MQGWLVEGRTLLLLLLLLSLLLPPRQLLKLFASCISY